MGTLAQDIEKMVLDLEMVARNATLEKEPRFAERLEAIAFVETQVIDPLEHGLGGRVKGLPGLEQRARSLAERLAEMNRAYFAGLRGEIRSGDAREFRKQLSKYANRDAEASPRGRMDYGVADTFVQTLLQIGDSPDETLEKEPEMVFYKPTPVRIILDLVEEADLCAEDVFYDLGSGLGQVVILVHLLSGARTKGVEYEPSYYAYAQERAKRLNLSNADFCNIDARHADYSDGTVFYLYTPFRGDLLQSVLDKLKAESHKRPIRICTCGPCTPSVSQQDWLKCVSEKHSDDIEYHTAIFAPV